MRDKAYKDRLFAFFLLIIGSLCGVLAQPVRQLTTADGLSDNHVHTVVALSDGRMAFATEMGINLYDGSHVARMPLTSDTIHAVPQGHVPSSMEADAADRVWLHRMGELYCLDLRHGRYVGDMDSLLSTIIPSWDSGDTLRAVFISHGELWVWHNNLLSSSSTKHAIRLPADFGELCGVVAQERDVWIFNAAGWASGYRRADGRQLFRAPVAKLPPEREFWIINIRPSADGKIIYLLFGGHVSRLYAFHTQKCTSRLLYSSDYLVRAVTPAPDGTLWLSTRRGYERITTDGQSLSPQRSFCLSDGDSTGTCDVSDILFMPHDSLQWMAMTDGGVLLRHTCPHALTSGRTTADVNVPDSLDWVFRSRRAALYRRIATHPDNDVLADSRGWQWQATSNGLIVKRADGTELTLRSDDGLPSDYVSSLVEDAQGGIWGTTPHGIFRIDPEAKMDITIYDTSDGCLLGEYQPSSAVRLTDGRIVMQGYDGWTVFDPKKVTKKTFRYLTPSLMRIAVNGLPLHAGSNANGISLEAEPPYTQSLRLRHDQNQLQFDFVAFNYAHPTQTCYRWRLVSGRDTTWHYVSRHDEIGLIDATGTLHLNMMQLPPGNYRLDVEAAIDTSSFCGGRATMLIHILPPWWQTWWAYTLYVLFAVTTVFLVVRVYVRRQRERLEWKRKEEVLQLKIMHLMEQGQRTDVAAEKTSEPESVTLSSEETDFLQRVTALINQHIGDSYSVEQLASDMCMERTGLYKRLTAIIDQSPQRFIRGIRLTRALELLRNTDQSITDIAFATGFTSPSYFVKCFREEHRCTPGEWRERQ